MQIILYCDSFGSTEKVIGGHATKAPHTGGTVEKARENIVQLRKQFTTDKLNVQLQNT